MTAASTIGATSAAMPVISAQMARQLGLRPSRTARP